MKKKILSMLLAMLMVMTLVPTAFADSDTVKYAVEGGNIHFDKSTGTVTGSSSYGSITKAVIPAEIDGVAVTSIGDYAFSNSMGLTSVTIPDSVTSIGCGAFNGCERLTSIEIPNSVTNIGNKAFIGCEGLTSIVIPNSVTWIGYSAFSYCTGLMSITIPNSVTHIGTYVFSGCTSLTSVTLSNSVGSIEGAFSGCTSLTSVMIPNSVTIIDDAFKGCTSLTSVTIPNGVRFISGAFEGCTSLTSVEIPGSVTNVSNYTFERCTSLTSVTIPNSVTRIGSNAFDGCTSLTDVYYSGSEEQWTVMTIAEGNELLTSATIHYYYNHAHVTELRNTVEPTCTQDGYTGDEVCNICGDIISKGEKIMAFGHDYSIIEVTGSTCAEQGYTTYTCTVCGESYIDNYIDAIGHTEETVAAVEATCTTAGKTEGTVCSVCGEVLIAQEEIPALGHKTEVRNAVEPTCTEAGYTGDEVCTICGETIKEGEVIPATGHHFKGNTCPDCGETRSTADTIRAWFQESFNNMKNFFDKIFGKK